MERAPQAAPTWVCTHGSSAVCTCTLTLARDVSGLRQPRDSTGRPQLFTSTSASGTPQPVPYFPLWSRRWGCPHKLLSPTAGIVVSSSASAGTSEGTSSDSCLTFSAGEGPAGFSGGLTTQGLLGTCSPVRMASPFLGAQSATPVLQAQGGLGGAVLLPVSFQEGRRASDTSLTQGEVSAMPPPS